MGDDLHVKYGGMRFTRHASPEEINRLSGELPMEERESLAMVVRKLEGSRVDLPGWATYNDH